MPYPHGHRQRTKQRIVESSRKLFNRFGFDRVSIQRIMADAGLTHGVFYHYFKSKSDLYVEALSCFFTDPRWKNAWKGVRIDPSAPDASAQIIRAYLSRRHLEDIDHSCPMVALPSDVARSGKATKRAFESAFNGMVRALARRDKDLEAWKDAQAAAALCVGGMVVARSLENPRLADKLLKSAAAVALELSAGRKMRSDIPAAAHGPKI